MSKGPVHSVHHSFEGRHVKMRKGPWSLLHFCVLCTVPLNNSEKWRNSGVCPHCGHKGDHAQKITESNERIARWVSTAKWYQDYRNHGYWEFKDGE